MNLAEAEDLALRPVRTKKIQDCEDWHMGLYKELFRFGRAYVWVLMGALREPWELQVLPQEVCILDDRRSDLWPAGKLTVLPGRADIDLRYVLTLYPGDGFPVRALTKKLFEWKNPMTAYDPPAEGTAK